MNFLHVGKSLLLEKGTYNGDVNLGGAVVGAQLVASCTTFATTLDMLGLQVGQDVLLREATCKGEVTLRGANVGGTLFADSSTFKKALCMDGLQVEQDLFLRACATCEGEVSFINAKVGRNLDLSGTTFHGNVNGSGATISGELRLGSEEQGSARWDLSSALVLRNTLVGALQDRIAKGPGVLLDDAWPKHLQLDGFAYSRLGRYAWQ